jgi:putative transcriptional regulator
MTAVTSKIRGADGRLVQVDAKGREIVMARRPFRPMSDAEVEPAALSAPDARPLSAEDSHRAMATPRTKVLRRALGLTQEEFAARYHIPVGALRDWEQGRAQPDQPARACLRAIAGDSHGVHRALETRPDWS